MMSTDWLVITMSLHALAHADWVTWSQCPNTTPRGEPLRVLQLETQDREAHSLFLDNCNINSVQPFSNTPNIRSISLKNNRINHLPTGVFDSTTHLKHLFLNDNDILGKYLNPNLLRPCKRLEHLYFSGNDMRDTPNDLLQGIDLHKIELIDCSLLEVPSFIRIPTFPNMKHLYLANNLIRNLNDPNTFSSALNLYLLDLSNNFIDSINENIFKKSTQLQKIYLKNNRINHLPEKLFQNKPYLDTIDVENNVIEYVPENAFRGTAPFELNLSGNRLTFLPEKFCSSLGHSRATLENFYFDRNPWQCGCLNDIIIEVKRLGIVYKTDRYHGQAPVCVMKNIKCNRLSEEYRQTYDTFKR